MKKILKYLLLVVIIITCGVILGYSAFILLENDEENQTVNNSTEETYEIEFISSEDALSIVSEIYFEYDVSLSSDNDISYIFKIIDKETNKTSFYVNLNKYTEEIKEKHSVGAGGGNE